MGVTLKACRKCGKAKPVLLPSHGLCSLVCWAGYVRPEKRARA